MKKIFFYLAFLCLTTGCSHQAKGIIVHKEIKPAETDTVFEPAIQCFNVKTYPKRYQITVQVDGHYQATYDIKDTEYDRYKVGDFFVTEWK